MDIEGPFKIGLIEDPLNPTHQLQFSFTPAFQALTLEERGPALREYIRRMQQMAGSLPEDSADRTGMQIVLQFAEQVLPHIENDELPLDESITVDIHSEIASVIPATSLGKSIN
jgi:hypothetical protein